MAEQNDKLSPVAPASDWERLFVVFVLLFSADAFSSLWTVPGQTQSASGMLIMQILWSLVYLVTLFLFFHHCQKPLRTLFSEMPLIALCGLVMVSVFWSQAPGLTFRRSIALILTLLFGVYFASRFSLREQLRLLAWTCGVCIVFSIIFGIFGLGRSVDYGEGVRGWYGIFDQKNGLGLFMALSALIFLFWRQAEPKHKWLANIGLMTSVALVALSRSMTAVLTLAMLLLLLPYLRWAVRKSVSHMVAAFALLAAAGAAALLYAAKHLELLTGLLGKSATFTGRIQIWILSFVMALRRPWLGYGYNAFWLQGQGSTVQIWHVLGWTAPNAHNGYLELWLEVGIVGLGLFLLVFSYYVIRGLKLFREYHGLGVAAWPLLFLIFNLVINLAEVDFLSRNTIFFILFVAAAMATRSRPASAWAPQPARTLSESPA